MIFKRDKSMENARGLIYIVRVFLGFVSPFHADNSMPSAYPSCCGGATHSVQ